MERIGGRAGPRFALDRWVLVLGPGARGASRRAAPGWLAGRVAAGGAWALDLRMVKAGCGPLLL